MKAKIGSTEMSEAEELCRFVAALATPYDGIDPDDEEAMFAVEDAMTGDDERDAAVELWELIAEARKIYPEAAPCQCEVRK